MSNSYNHAAELVDILNDYLAEMQDDIQRDCETVKGKKRANLVLKSLFKYTEAIENGIDEISNKCE